MRLAEHFTEPITSVLGPSSDEKGQNMVPRLVESFAFILTLLVVSSWAEVGVVQLMAVVWEENAFLILFIEMFAGHRTVLLAQTALPVWL